MAWLAPIVAGLAVMGLTAAAVCLFLTARHAAPRWLGAARWAALGACIVPLAPRGAPAWSIGLAAVGVIVAVQALALAACKRQLRDYAAMRRKTADADPPWWPDLERQFRRQAEANEKVKRRREPR